MLIALLMSLLCSKLSPSLPPVGLQILIKTFSSHLLLISISIIIRIIMASVEVSLAVHITNNLYYNYAKPSIHIS